MRNLISGIKNNGDGERLTEEAKLLAQYLNQYRYCVGQKKTLENRRQEILKEFENPLRSRRMDGMPKGSRSQLGCAEIPLQLDEIDTKIKEQLEHTKQVLVNIINIINFLPESSIERSIIENRYIDRYSWEKVCQENLISRTPATKKWRKGLYMLLEQQKVQEILKEYQKQIQD